MPTPTSKLLGGIKAYGLGFDSTAYMAGNIFELYPVVFSPFVAIPGGGLEGSIPLAPGQLQDLYQPVSGDSPYLVPWRKDYKPTKLNHVGIKIKFQGEENFAADTYFLVQEPENAFTVELIPLPPKAPTVVFTQKPIEVKVGMTPTKPRMTLKRKRTVKILKKDK